MPWWVYLILIAMAGGVAWYLITRRRSDYIDHKALKRVDDAVAAKTKAVEDETAAKLAKAKSSVGADLLEIEAEHADKIETIEKDKKNALETLRTDPTALDDKLYELLRK